MLGRYVGQLDTRQSNPASNQAFSLSPSQNWDGNDGAWSTFVIRVGTPSQYFRVLPSISSSSTYLPLPLNCSQGVSSCGNARGVEPFKSPSTAISTTVSTLDPGLTCSANRGPSCENCFSVNGKCTDGVCAGQYCCGGDPGACNSAGCNGVSGLCTQSYIGCPCIGDDYDASSKPKDPGAASPAAALGFWAGLSSTWNAISNTTLRTNDNPLAIPGNGSFGMDTVGLGPTPEVGLSVSQKTVVAGVPTGSSYLGLLGLQPSNSSRFNQSSPSLLTTLMNDGLIPSTSYGYTAGAIYREQGVLGSLTLGGYDASRFIPNDMTFPISTSGQNASRLEAGLQSITASGTLVGDVTLLSSNITVAIDSAQPYLYLPKASCSVFERAFGLTLNSSLNLYQPNTTAHGALRKSNPSLSFQFGASASDMLNITLPYQAFDLQTTAPITQNGTNYFPIRCTSDSSQFVLGRAFLQETYLLADYVTGNFSISQVDFSGKQANIVTINHADKPTTPTDNSAPGSASSGLGKGTIAGIAVGASIAVILLLSVLFFFCRKRKAKDSASKRGSISAPIPYDASKESWPSSPASSQTHKFNPTSNNNNNNNTIVSGFSGQTPAVQSFEERLQRLERAGTTRVPDLELPNTNSYVESRKMRNEYGPRLKQELPGSATAAEIASKSRRASKDERENVEEKPPVPAKDVFELADERSGRGSS